MLAPHPRKPQDLQAGCNPEPQPRALSRENLKSLQESALVIRCLAASTGNLTFMSSVSVELQFIYCYCTREKL